MADKRGKLGWYVLGGLFIVLLAAVGLIVWILATQPPTSHEPPPALETKGATNDPTPSRDRATGANVAKTGVSWAGERYYGGAPQATKAFTGHIQALDNTGFSVGFCPERKTAAWVAFRIFRNGKHLSPKRPDKFTADPRLGDSPVSSDYSGTGYDRGHMAPNHIIAICYGEDAQRETFILSNIIPQKPKLNRDVWRELEETEADTWREKFGTVWVITGPVYDADEQRLKRGEEIPDACYRIDVREDAGQPVVIAFEIPQTVTGIEKPTQFITTVDQIEKDTGLDFLRDLPDGLEDKVEAEKSGVSW